jgi:curved DNA-binding protein CbpA
MRKWDYYAVLGLGRGATTEEVKAVYRQLARTFHPDANVEAAKAEDFAAAERFKKITEAYTVLSDPEKRALYDRYGESWREAEKKGRRAPARSRAPSVPTSKPRRKRRRQDYLLEHTERRFGVSVAGIELIGVGMTVDVRSGLLDEEEASDGTPPSADRAAAPAREGLKASGQGGGSPIRTRRARP